MVSKEKTVISMIKIHGRTVLFSQVVDELHNLNKFNKLAFKTRAILMATEQKDTTMNWISKHI